jgi:hypothetical protein
MHSVAHFVLYPSFLISSNHAVVSSTLALSLHTSTSVSAIESRSLKSMPPVTNVQRRRVALNTFLALLRKGDVGHSR